MCTDNNCCNVVYVTTVDVSSPSLDNERLGEYRFILHYTLPAADLHQVSCSNCCWHHIPNAIRGDNECGATAEG